MQIGFDSAHAVQTWLRKEFMNATKTQNKHSIEIHKEHPYKCKTFGRKNKLGFPFDHGTRCTQSKRNVVIDKFQYHLVVARLNKHLCVVDACFDVF